jgi:hypothetical protein
MKKYFEIGDGILVTSEILESSEDPDKEVKRKLYPAGQFCKACNAPLTQSNPRDTCYRCQGLGIVGQPRKPISNSRIKK